LLPPSSRRRNSEDLDLHLHRYENLKYRIFPINFYRTPLELSNIMSCGLDVLHSPPRCLNYLSLLSRPEQFRDPREYGGRNVKLFIYLHLAPKVRKTWSFTSTPR